MLALQAGIAASADAVLIPEIPFDLAKVAAHLNRKLDGKVSALVVVAEGARPCQREAPVMESRDAGDAMRRALSPGASAEGTDAAISVVDVVGKLEGLAASNHRSSTGKRQLWICSSRST
jgi:ATP-dependent phosphofructokinase / diphosphate-dependent phosphofructokinase